MPRRWFPRWIASGYVRPSLPGRWPVATAIPRSRATLAVFSSSSPITLWLFAVTPTRFPAATRSTIILAPTVLFPDPGGPLDCEVALVECEHEAPRCFLRAVVSSQRRPVAPARPRRAAHQQVARRAVLTGPVDILLDYPPRQPLQTLGLRRRSDVIMRNEGGRRWRRTARTASQVDVVVAHAEDSSRSATGHRNRAAGLRRGSDVPAAGNGKR